MKLNITPAQEIDWTRLWWIVGIVTVFWGGLASLTIMYPVLDDVYKVVNVILTAILSALLFAARANKYVKDRVEPPENGKP